MKLVLEKLTHQPGRPLVCLLGEKRIRPGDEFSLRATGRKFCIACAREVRRTYRGGYCYPCSQTLARADACIIKPHTCHFHRGTCREPDWGREHCFVPHVVYLALTSHVKVGVTSARRTFQRWAEQGARQALLLARCPDRRTAGLIEYAVSRELSDRTAWRAMLSGKSASVDWTEQHRRAAALVPAGLRKFVVPAGEITVLEHPVRAYLERPLSQQLDRRPGFSGTLQGIVGQYLLLSDRALNIRRHAGYEVDFSQNPGDRPK